MVEEIENETVSMKIRKISEIIYLIIFFIASL